MVLCFMKTNPYHLTEKARNFLPHSNKASMFSHGIDNVFKLLGKVYVCHTRNLCLYILTS